MEIAELSMCELILQHCTVSYLGIRRTKYHVLVLSSILTTSLWTSIITTVTELKKQNKSNPVE
jgi:hypothetical protein